jgi:alpha-L-fucosidase
MTMNDTWGYKSYDNNWKSSEELVRKLIDTASKGGNFLLNVGPTSEGVIPQPSVDRLKDIGRWMAVNHEAIYGTTAGPFPYLRWGRAARKGNILYLYVFDWPKSGVLKVPLKNKVTAAYLVAAPHNAVPVTVEGERISLKLPASAPDPIASVIALQIVGEAEAVPVPSLGRPGRASSVSGQAFGPEKAFDGDHETYWRAADGQHSAWLEVTLAKPSSIGCVTLIEGWENQSHTRRFRLEYKEGDEWQTIFEGTRIGRALSRAFEPVTARVFRLNILEATDAPQIEEMQLLIDE